MGAVFERMRNGRIEIALQTDERHKNLSGFVHGGVMMTLFDRTVGINCRQDCDGARIATATMTVNFLRQVAVGDFLRMTCDLRKKGRTTIFADAEATVGDRLVATASGLMMRIG